MKDSQPTHGTTMTALSISKANNERFSTTMNRAPSVNKYIKGE